MRHAVIHVFIYSFIIFCLKHTGQSILFPGKHQRIWRRLSIQLRTQLSGISCYKLEHGAEKEEPAAPHRTFPEREREKNALGQSAWEMQGREIIQPPQVRAAGGQRVASSASKYIVPHPGSIYRTKSKAAVINMDNTRQPRLTYLELKHDPSLKRKQLFLFEQTKSWAFISPFMTQRTVLKIYDFPK